MPFMHRPKLNKTFTLKQRFILFFSAGLLSVLCIIVFVLAKELRASYTELFIERGEHAADELVYQTARLFQLGLSPKDFVGYDKLLLETLKKNEGVIFVALIDEKKQLLFSAGDTPTRQLIKQNTLNISNLNELQIVSSFETLSKQHKWSVVVMLDANLIMVKTTNFLKHVLFYSCLLIILVILCFTLFININVGRPVNQLVREIQNASLENIDYFNPQLRARGDELGVTARTFVSLMKRLGYSQLALAKANKDLQLLTTDLEKRVEERTKEIENMNIKLKALAHLDPLTGLLNRFSFEQDLPLRYQAAKINQQPFIVMVADLNGFKAVNDTYGHDAGDHTLRVIGERLSNHFQYGHCVYRLGGDEFVIIIEKALSAKQISDVVLAFRNLIIQPINYEGEPLPFGVSVGVASSDSCAGCNAKQILQHADRAMYEAKAKGVDFIIKH